MELSLDRKSAPSYQRLLLCASTAITSALAIITLRWYRRKRRRLRLKGAGLDNPKAVEDDTPAPGAQVEAAIAKVKELESLIVLNKTEKAALNKESSEAVRKLKAAAKTEKELRHQLGKVRFAAKEFEDSYNLIYKTQEEALSKARDLEAEKKELEAQVNGSKTSLSGVQRSLAAETGARKVAERKVRQLELDVSSALSSKASLERNWRQAVQGLEKRVEEAEGKRKQAEAELEKHKAQIAPTRTKIEAFGKRFVDLEQSYRLSQEALQRTEARCNAEQKAKAALEPRLKAAESRVVELEKELRITKEAARSRMRRTSSRSSIESR